MNYDDSYEIRQHAQVHLNRANGQMDLIDSLFFKFLVRKDVRKSDITETQRLMKECEENIQNALNDLKKLKDALNEINESNK